MRFAQVTRDVAEQLNEASERYQVPQRLRYAGETARETARMASESARRGAQQAYQMALEHPRTSAAAGIILAAAIVGGVLWYIFGGEREEQQQRRPRRVRAGTGRKRARTARASRAAAQ
jgi:hypothetical protein